MEVPKNICVVVLGDIGRSPRIQYHSMSLAEQGHKVDIVSYQVTRPAEALLSQPLVNFHYLLEYPQLPFPKIINLVLKTLWQAVSLLFVLCIIRKPDVLLVQNPPAVPALLICRLYCAISKSKYVIDWHNYAHTIMSLSVGNKSSLVRLTEKLEVFCGQRAHENFCVTNEMRNDLFDKWHIRAITLYDRPPDMFRPISPQEKHEVIKRLSDKYSELKGTSCEDTVFTMLDVDQTVTLKKNRPGLLISSTSWTEDEDFSILLKSLQDFEDHHKEGNHRKLPELICVITGIGPLKQYYCDKIQQQNWKHVKIITPWLEAKDYPLLLASSDLGVSLHTSSSGLDLPMKVVDMFGCGLPVCAYNFKCLYELVKHDKNSFVFNTPEELSQQLQTWFEDFPNNHEQLRKLKEFQKELEAFQNVRWKENWLTVAADVFK